MNKLHRSNSDSLFILKNKQSLEKLRIRSSNKSQTLAVPFLQSKKVMKEDNQKRSNILKEKSSKLILEKPPNSNILVRINSHNRSRQQSESAKKIIDKQNSSKSNRKTESKAYLRPKKLQPFQLNSIKNPLKIETSSQFRSIVPSEGFIHGTHIFEQHAKKQQLIISPNGVLIQQSNGWEFKQLSEYEQNLMKIEKIKELSFFKYFYYLKSLLKWKKVYRKGKITQIVNKLLKEKTFSDLSLIFTLKQQKIFNDYLNAGFTVCLLHYGNEISFQKYDNYLYDCVHIRLQELRLKVVESFLLQIVKSMRLMVCQYYQKKMQGYMIPINEYEDYYMRNLIEQHQLILYKFILKYEQLKLDVVKLILNELQKKIKYSINKWKEQCLQVESEDQSIVKGNIYLEKITRYFSMQQKQSMTLDSYFDHDIKIDQLWIPISSTKLDINQIQSISENLILTFHHKIHSYICQKYMSYMKQTSQIQKLLADLYFKNTISQRQLSILKEPLKKVDYYCYAVLSKKQAEKIQIQIKELTDVIEDNFSYVQKVVQIINEVFVERMDRFIGNDEEYTFQNLTLVQNKIKILEKMTTKVKMGIFTIDVGTQAAYYLGILRSKHRQILRECTKIYRQKINNINKNMYQFDSSINLSTWTIRDFIDSYHRSHSYLFYHENAHKNNLSQLESILLIVHKLQLKQYEPCYVELLHLKELAEEVKNKVYSFFKEVTHKLKYLSAQKDKRFEKLNKQIDSMHHQIGNLTATDIFDFRESHQILRQTNIQLERQAKNIEEIEKLIQIEKIYFMKENKKIQFVTYEQFRTQVFCLIQLMEHYNSFHELFNQELQRQYHSFRLQLLVDTISNEVAKIKQTVRFLHQYEKLLLNLNSLYQSANPKLKFLRLAIQLQEIDLKHLDRTFFAHQQQLITAEKMLFYVEANQLKVRKYLEKKQFTNKLKDHMAKIQSKLESFICHGEGNNSLRAINEQTQILNCYQVELKTIVLNEYIKEINIPIIDFLELLTKSIHFLHEYSQLIGNKDQYMAYFCQVEQYPDSKFNILYYPQAKNIDKKWVKLQDELAQTNLKYLVQFKYEQYKKVIHQIQDGIKCEKIKIKNYINKKIEDFPFYQLLTNEQLIRVLNYPLDFLKYHFPSVKEVKTDKKHNNIVSIETLYYEKIEISLENKKPISISKQMSLENNPLKNSISKSVLDLNRLMKQISYSIKNTTVNLIKIPFNQFLALLRTQLLPLQVIFVVDQLNNSLLTGDNYQIRDIIEKHLSLLISAFRHSETTSYQKHVFEILLISKLQFKNKIKIHPNFQISPLFSYKYQNDEIFLRVGEDRLKVECQLIDPTELMIIEPVNERTMLKVYYSLEQGTSLVMFEESSLKNMGVRLMKRVIMLDKNLLTVEKIVALSSHQPVMMYLSNRNTHREEFYAILRAAQAALITYSSEHYRSLQIQKDKPYTKPSIYIQAPQQLYHFHISQKIPTFYNELPIQIRLKFRVVQVCKPSFNMILTLVNTKNQVQMSDRVTKEVLRQCYKYYSNNELQVTSKDLIIVLEDILNRLDKKERIEHANIISLFNEIIFPEQGIAKQAQNKKVLFSINNQEPLKIISAIIASLQLNKPSFELIKFIKSFDNSLSTHFITIVVGRPLTGKSYLTNHYVSLVNEYSKEKIQSGYKDVKGIILQKIDTSLIGDLSKEKAAQLVEQKMTAFNNTRDNDKNDLIYWFEDVTGDSKYIYQSLLKNKNFYEPEYKSQKIVIQCSSLGNFTPRMIQNCGKIILSQTTYTYGDICKQGQTKVLSLFHRNHFIANFDPFQIMPSIFSLLFEHQQLKFQQLFKIPYRPHLILINAFQLVYGIIKEKSPELVDNLIQGSELTRNVSLRRLLIFSFLWVSSLLLKDQIFKKYQQIFLTLCSSSNIPIQHLDHTHFLNHSSKNLQYLPIKQQRHLLLNHFYQIYEHRYFYLQTHQIIILYNMMNYLTQGQKSKIMVSGVRNGKSAFLKHFSSQKQKQMHGCMTISLYTIQGIHAIGKKMSLIRNNIKGSQNKLIKNTEQTFIKLQNAIKQAKYLIVENISMTLWPEALGHLRYLSSFSSYVKGQFFDPGNFHLIIQRHQTHLSIPSQLHFFPFHLQFEQQYINDIFLGILEASITINKQPLPLKEEILKTKNKIIKSILSLMKQINKSILQNYNNWSYYYPLNIIKDIIMKMSQFQFKDKKDYIENLFDKLKNSITMRISNDNDHCVATKFIEKVCKQLIGEDKSTFKSHREEEQPYQYVVSKLNNYFDYKNQFKTLKRNDTLLRNLDTLHRGLKNADSLLIINHCLIPGVGDFLPIASQILSIQLIDVISLEQMKLLQTDQKFNADSQKETTIYLIPCWVIKDNVILEYLANFILDLQNREVAKAKIIKKQVISGSPYLTQGIDKDKQKVSKNSKKVIWVIQYNEQSYLRDQNMIKFRQLMDRATFIHIESPTEAQITTELSWFLRMEKQELELIDNDFIIDKIRTIYHSICSEIQRKSILPKYIKYYLLDINNYYRFLQTIIDTYFERKYEIKSNLQQLEQTIIKLQQYCRQYHQIIENSMDIKQNMRQRQNRIKFFQANLDSIDKTLHQFKEKKSYQTYKDIENQIHKAEKSKQKMKSKEKQILDQIEAHKNIPRSDIANLKSLYANNPLQVNPIFQILAMLIYENRDSSTIKKTMQDINLIMRIRQIDFKDKSEQLMIQVKARLKSLIEEDQTRKCCNTLFLWLKYKTDHYFYEMDMEQKLRQIVHSRKKTFTNLEGIEIKKKLQDFELEKKQIQEKMKIQKLNINQLEVKLTQKELVMKKIDQFQLLQQFLQQCLTQKQHLTLQSKMCLESSIYFSLKLNFIYPSDTSFGDIHSKNSKNKKNNFSQFVDNIFIKHSKELSSNVNIQFFNSQINQIFVNKQKYYFIDHEFNNQINPISKCKKIGQLVGRRFSKNSQEKIKLDRFLPSQVYNKFIILKYMISFRSYFTKIMVKDTQNMMMKSIGLSQKNLFTIPENGVSLDNGKNTHLTGYRLRKYDESLLYTGFSIYFINVSCPLLEFTFKSMPKTSNKNKNQQFYLLKMNQKQYTFSEDDQVKVILVCKDITNLERLKQFHFINFDNSYNDYQELVNRQFTKQLSYTEQLNSFVLQQNEKIDPLILSNSIKSCQRAKDILELQLSQKQYKYDIIWKDNLLKSRQKLTFVNQIQFKQLINKLQSWKNSKNRTLAYQHTHSLIKKFQQINISKYTSEILDIFIICHQVCKTILLKKPYLKLKEQEYHLSEGYMLQLVRNSIQNIFNDENKDKQFSEDSSNNEQDAYKQKLQKVIQFILYYQCSEAPFKDYNTLALYLRTYAIKSNNATDYEILNLLHKVNQEKTLEQLTEYKIQTINQAYLQNLPIYKLELEKFLKLLRDYRIQKGEKAQLFKNKNLISNPNHINAFIHNYEFKSLPKENEIKTHKSLKVQQNDEFKQLSTFNRFLLQKMLIPGIFVDDIWNQASVWFSMLEMSHNQIQNVNINRFFFCNVTFWSEFLIKHCSSFVSIIKIIDQQKEQLDIINKTLSETAMSSKDGQQLILLIDERNWSLNQPQLQRTKSKLSQYFTLKNSNLLVVINNQCHQLFHKMGQQTKIRVQIRCLSINKIISIIEDSNRKVRKQKNKFQGIYNQCLRQYRDADQIKIFGLQIKSCFDASRPISDDYELQVFNKILIWKPFMSNQISCIHQNIKNTYLKAPLNIVYGIEAVQSQNKISNRHETIINYFHKNKTQISAYFKSKLQNKPLKSFQPNTEIYKSINKIVCRFSSNLTTKINLEMIQPKRTVRRKSRMKSFNGGRSSELHKILNEDYQFKNYLQEYLNQLLKKIQEKIEKIHHLCKVYKGDISIIDHYEITCQGHLDIKAQINYQYDQLLEIIVQFDEILLIKEQKNIEVVLTNSTSKELQASNNQALMNILYHQTSRQENETILRCYDSNKCEECSILTNRKSGQRLLIEFNHKLYELCLSSYIISKSSPTISIRVGPNLIAATVYCSKVIRQIS